MRETALFEDEALEELDDAFAEGGDVADALDELDELGEEIDALGGDELDSAFGEAFEEDVDELAAGEDLDSFGEFAADAGSGLYLPRRGPLIAGPAAVAAASRLNPFVLESLDADEADAFFRRVGRALRRVGRGIGRAARGIGRGISRVARGAIQVARRVGRVAGPLLRRALPIIQRVAGLAGPWGRVISAGIGAARGLLAGRGLRGALAGALSGAIPGIGGRLAGAVLGGDGADDDAALDALADMSDAGQVPADVALPLGAGLAARVATPRPIGSWSPGLKQQARRTESTMLRAATAARGTAGRRLRVLRSIARLVRAMLQRRAARGGSGAAALPAAAQTAARQVLSRIGQRPGIGASTPTAAARRVAARRMILNRVPRGMLFPGFPGLAPAA